MKQLLLSLFLLISFAAGAQHPLSQARRSSVYDYLYELNDRETSEICSRGMRKINTSFLHTLLDSFPHDKGIPQHMAPGNYLRVYAEGNQLHTHFMHVPNVYAKLVSNKRDLIIVLHDEKGRFVKDAQVKIASHSLHYDAQANSWRLNKYRRSGMLKIYYKGLLSCLPLTKYPASYKRLLLTHWFRKKDSDTYDDEEDDNTVNKHYSGYIVFSKPKYKPLDTVKVKAYLADRKGRPVNKPLLLRLSNQHFVTDTILTTLQPDRPGAYTYEFVLSPGMHLDLDENYTITLETTGSRKYDLATYEGDLDEEEYAAKRKVLIRGKFRHEDYELPALTFNARLDKQLHTGHEPVAVFLQAKDENDLPVMDGQVQLFITTPDVQQYHAREVIIPDTIWRYAGPMETLGETKISLPDSIFPKADLKYRIECIFTNSNNERKTETLTATYHYTEGRFEFTLRGDSLNITLAGTTQAGTTVQIYGLNTNKDTLETHTLQLPARLKINPFLSVYKVKSGDITDSYTLKRASDLIYCDISWLNDTTAIEIRNPNKLAFWYTIFAGKRVMLRGYGDTLKWSAPSLRKEKYELRLSYIWEGEVQNVPVYFGDPGGQLHVSMAAPAVIYPGQTTQITINVKDKYLRPVANADITAYAHTSKFIYNSAPLIPSYNIHFKERKVRQQLSHSPEPLPEGSLALEWQRYGKRMGLDSLLFFRFTHPAPRFTYTENADDKVTQIAPFVFVRGNMQPVHIIYIDEVPVFSTTADPIQPYSIRVSAGKHTIGLRTSSHYISFNMQIADGVKTFVSIDPTIPQAETFVEAKPDHLIPSEMLVLQHYMIRLKNTFHTAPFYVKQQDRLFWLNNTSDGDIDYTSTYMVGPLTGATASLISKGAFSQDFTPEPGYIFEITKGLIKQKQLTVSQLPYELRDFSRANIDLSARALTENGIDTIWKHTQDDKLRKVDISDRIRPDKPNNGRLAILLKHPALDPKKDVLQFFFFRYDNPSFAKSFSGLSTKFGGMEKGYYKLFVLLTGQRYLLKDSLLVKDNSLHYYVFDSLEIMPPDTLSSQIDEQIRQTTEPGFLLWKVPDLETNIAETFNRKSFNNANLTRTIHGIVTDLKGAPLPGAEISLRGTRSACIANSNGEFSMNVTPNGLLDVKYTGYYSEERRLDKEEMYMIKLIAEKRAREEIAVLALGIREQKVLGYSVSTVTQDTARASFAQALYGKAAGVQVRGMSSRPIFSPPAPIIIVNGVIFNGTMEDLPKEGVKIVKVLKGIEATSLYGSAAAGGVIIVTTGEPEDTKSNELLPSLPANSIRTNFRDDAFWQPRLTTDANGNASFNVTFPDDITSWNAYAIAMSGKQQSGVKQLLIRSFKTLSGNLALPAFAVEGDTIHVISKALNYMPEGITAFRTFSMNDSVYRTGAITFKNAFIDTIPVVINSGDSVNFKYSLNKDGYLDGEQRKLPVVKRGTEETTGVFAALHNDTAFTYISARQGPVKVHAETSILPVLMDEISQVQRYKYLCNEQLASKLKVYLLEKKIAAYLKKDFKKDKDISIIIDRLNQQKKNGLWGWWQDAPVSLWISQHVIEALLMAKEQGYKADFNKQVAIDHFVYQLNSGNETDSIGCMQLLSYLGAKINYSWYVDSLIARAGARGYDTARLAALQQQTGLRVDMTALLAHEKETLFGNIYWGKDAYHLFNNSIQETLQRYRVLRKAGGHEALLQKIRGYFLEQRKDGHWRNTYESSLILETILPDVLTDEAQGPVSLTINGTKITQFPYTDTLDYAGKINISKQGKMPVYFTAYQQFHNRQPEKTSNQFTVSSVFTDGRAIQQDLKAGVPVSLTVDVTVDKTADYVLVEIPIPAGCSYQSKSQAWDNNEVHREHFKDHVSIFCSQLRPGKHTFTVSLLPRYTGRYYLNPAKAEMQYFPIFMGRESLKQVDIH